MFKIIITPTDNRKNFSKKFRKYFLSLIEKTDFVNNRNDHIIIQMIYFIYIYKYFSNQI